MVELYTQILLLFQPEKNHKYGDIETLKSLEIVLSGVHSNFILFYFFRYGEIASGEFVTGY